MEAATHKKLSDAIANCDFVIFDNDGVTYSITKKMEDACAHAAAHVGQQLVPGLSFDEAFKLGCESYKEHGSNTRVFAVRYGIDEKILHAAFHHHAVVNLEVSNEGIAAEFDKFHMPRAMLTLADRVWAYRVLDQLELRRHFPNKSIYTCAEIGESKAVSPKPYVHVLDREGFQAARTLMIEDTPINLVHAKALGMITVLITGDKIIAPGQYPHADFLIKNVREFLAAAHGLHPRLPAAPGKPILPVPGNLT
ncbi:MAG: HAD family hydrolase [Alphaproteobacteria bacterium]